MKVEDFTTRTTLGPELYDNAKWKQAIAVHRSNIKRYSDELQGLIKAEKMNTIYRIYQAASPTKRQECIDTVVGQMRERLSSLVKPATSLVPEFSESYIRRNDCMVCVGALLQLSL